MGKADASEFIRRGCGRGCYKNKGIEIRVMLSNKKSRIWESEAIKRSIKITEGRAREARRAGVDVSVAEEKIEGAIRLFDEQEDEIEAGKEERKARRELDNIVNAQKREKFPRWFSIKYLGCIRRFYGIYSFSPSLILMPVFFILLYHFPNLSFNLGDIRIYLWSLWIAGIGSAIQVLVGVSSDLKEKGMVCKYERIWYLLLPIISLGFGFAAYLIIGCGLWTFGGDVTAMEKHSLFPMLICFLVGYSTDWFREKLTSIMETLK